MLKKIDIENFKSIKKQSVELTKLNVLVGQNGAGKSNFISLFKFLERLVEQQLSDYIFKSGGINSFLFNGYENSEFIKINISIDADKLNLDLYRVTIESNGEDYQITDEAICLGEEQEKKDLTMLSPQKESKLKALFNIHYRHSHPLTSLKTYHFHDTSNNASLKIPQSIEDVYTFKSEAENIAPILLWLKSKFYDRYFRIVEAVRLVFPQLNDFELSESPTAQGKIVLRWSEKGTSNIFSVKQISDGTLRFICLATILLMPENSRAVTETIILDEPELGLHPFAIHVLAELIKKASIHRQIILATQSVTLINYFEPEDLLIVERKDSGETVFSRKNSNKLQEWLKDYTLGELWENNFFGGRP